MGFATRTIQNSSAGLILACLFVLLLPSLPPVPITPQTRTGEEKSSETERERERETESVCKNICGDAKYRQFYKIHPESSSILRPLPRFLPRCSSLHPRFYQVQSSKV